MLFAIIPVLNYVKFKSLLPIRSEELMQRARSAASMERAARLLPLGPSLPLRTNKSSHLVLKHLQVGLNTTPVPALAACSMLLKAPLGHPILQSGKGSRLRHGTCHTVSSNL